MNITDICYANMKLAGNTDMNSVTRLAGIKTKSIIIYITPMLKWLHMRNKHVYSLVQQFWSVLITSLLVSTVQEFFYIYILSFKYMRGENWHVCDLSAWTFCLTACPPQLLLVCSFKAASRTAAGASQRLKPELQKSTGDIMEASSIAFYFILNV